MSNTLTKQAINAILSETRTWIPQSGRPAFCVDYPVTVQPGHFIRIPADPPDHPHDVLFWVVDGPPHDIIQHVCYDAEPVIPGHYETTPNWGLDYQLGWTGAARSIAALTGDGLYQFSVPASAVGVVSGFNSLNEGESYAEMEHAIYCHSGNFEIMESGISRSGERAFTSNDIFTIVRQNQQVRYYQGSTLLYVSNKASSSPVFADVSLYAAPDAIVNASLTAGVVGFLPGPTPPVFYSEAAYCSVNGVLPGLIGNAQQTAGGYLTGTLTTLTCNASANYYGSYNKVLSMSGALTALTAEIWGSEGDGKQYSSCLGYLTVITGSARDDSEMKPPITIVEGVLGAVSGFALAVVGTNGSCTGNLPTLVGFSSNSNGAYLQNGILTPITGYSTIYLPIENALYEELPRLRLRGTGASKNIISSDGKPLPGYGLYGKLPALKGGGYGTGVAALELPKLSLAATGTAITIAELAVSLPKLIVKITGTYTIIGAFKAKLPKLKLTAGGVNAGADYLSATAAGVMRLPTLEMVGSGATHFGKLAKRLPRLKLHGTGTIGLTGAFAAKLPALRMVTTGAFAVRLPALTMRALGKLTVAVEYEAYSFTLMPQTDGEIGTAATRLTDHPFERIVRFQDHYYGIAVDGIHLLEGDNYAGAPIVATVETGSEDYDHPQLKRLEALWFSGRCGADMNVAAISAETEEPVYFMSPDKVGARAQRVEFGRGTEARYWAVRFTNVRGEDFQVENAASEITVLKRTHGGPS